MKEIKKQTGIEDYRDESGRAANLLPTEAPHASIDSPNTKDDKTSEDRAHAIGQRLAQLREEKQCLLDDVCAQLKVPVEKLRALEAGDFNQLPDAAFTLGIVRSYAKMFGADPTPLVAELRRVHGPIERELVLPGLHRRGFLRKHLPPMTQTRRSKKRRLWLWSGSALVLVGCIVAYWQGARKFTQTPQTPLAAISRSPTQVKPLGSKGITPQSKLLNIVQHSDPSDHLPTQLPASPLSASSLQKEKPSSSLAGINSSQSEKSKVLKSSKESKGLSQAFDKTKEEKNEKAAASSMEESWVHFKVSQDNWISVHQRDGKEVYAGLLHAGDECNAKGLPPFQVTVGNQAGLETVMVDEKPVDLSKYRQAGQRVVRFNLP